MNILLVYCNSMLENALPIGISQVSACLKESGFNVDLFDTTFYHYAEKSDMENRINALQFPPCPFSYNAGDIFSDFNSIIASFRPDLIGFSVVEPTMMLGVRLFESARAIISQNKIKVVVGGVIAIISPETVASLFSNADFICVGEGEVVMLELCRNLVKEKEFSTIKGLWIKCETGWMKNQLPPLVDINTLPVLDFTIFSEAFLNKPMMGKVFRTISIETTRGCPYNCSYCGDHSLTLRYKNLGNWFRSKSMEKIDNELKEYIQEYSPEFVYIMSESFLSGSLRKVRSFSEMYSKYSIPFWFNTRPEDITEEKVQLVKSVGCMRISIGLEHGNEEFRRKHLHRKYSNELFINSCMILRRNGISFSINLIIGFPYDTRELIFEAIDLLKLVKPDGVSTHIFSPYHGTEMRDIAVREGMIHEDLIADDFFQGYCLKNTSLSESEIFGLFRTIPLYIEMDQVNYSRIRKAEAFTDEGNKMFKELQDEYYKIKNWE